MDFLPRSIVSRRVFVFRLAANPPADINPGQGVKNQAHINDTRLSRHERQVGDPNLLWCRCGEVTFHQVWMLHRYRNHFCCFHLPERPTPWIPRERITRDSLAPLNSSSSPLCWFAQLPNPLYLRILLSERIKFPRQHRITKCPG